LPFEDKIIARLLKGVCLDYDVATADFGFLSLASSRMLDIIARLFAACEEGWASWS
jgi:hypothetical protein